MHSLQRKVLRTICPDQKGLIARITNICYKHQLNIIKNDEFVDHENGRFFMRTELEGRFNDETLLADLDDALPAGAQRRLVKAGKKGATNYLMSANLGTTGANGIGNVAKGTLNSSATDAERAQMFDASTPLELDIVLVVAGSVGITIEMDEDGVGGLRP